MTNPIRIIEIVTQGPQGRPGVDGGISDGDKGDINVSGGGTNWEINPNVIATVNLEDGSVTESKIPNNELPLTKLANINGNRILGRSESNDGVVRQLTDAEVRLNNFLLCWNLPSEFLQ